MKYASLTTRIIFVKLVTMLCFCFHVPEWVTKAHERDNLHVPGQELFVDMH
jgi:hypothetical protein